MANSKEEVFSLKLDRFVKSTNEELMKLSAEAEQFNISLDFNLMYTTLGSQLKVAKEYQLKDPQDLKDFYEHDED